MDSLYYVDMSNNSFDSSEAPTWFSNLRSLTALVLEGGSFTGPIPEDLFSAPQLQLVKLGNNSFNGTLDMGNSISSNLELVDLQFNNISSLSSAYNNTLLPYGNLDLTISYHLLTTSQHTRNFRESSDKLLHFIGPSCIFIGFGFHRRDKEDLRPWKASRISKEMVERGKPMADFRLVILNG
ncbi:hypothetical protein H6P81_006580 [Aristolochia fimbriata]|uniref:Uncharacterized protein n=1 Tax=Aristolochia fimbriata TaxID=158543 RepID=A0AAV7F1E9_ARIFI|nr:hypothetical protein H6P81_006580 [Aristolochia fimbriata]